MLGPSRVFVWLSTQTRANRSDEPPKARCCRLNKHEVPLANDFALSGSAKKVSDRQQWSYLNPSDQPDPQWGPNKHTQIEVHCSSIASCSELSDPWNPAQACFEGDGTQLKLCSELSPSKYSHPGHFWTIMQEMICYLSDLMLDGSTLQLHHSWLFPPRKSLFDSCLLKFIALWSDQGLC